jgi:hypothetical protein
MLAQRGRAPKVASRRDRPERIRLT